jgi:hypothetical protein
MRAVDAELAASHETAGEAYLAAGRSFRSPKREPIWGTPRGGGCAVVVQHQTLRFGPLENLLEAHAYKRELAPS